MKKDIYLTLAKELIKKGNATVFFPRGGSMKPFIRDSEKIVVQACDIYGVKPAQIVMFHADKRLIVHRVIKIGDSRGGTLLTKGDSSYHFDKPVTRAKFLGRVIEVEKRTGTLKLDSRGAARLSKYMRIYSVFMGNIVRVLTVFTPVFKKKSHRMKDFTYAVLYQSLYFLFDIGIKSCVTKPAADKIKVKEDE